MATYMYMQTAEERAVASSRRPSLAGEVGCSRAALAAAGASTDGAGNGGAAAAIYPRPPALAKPEKKQGRGQADHAHRAAWEEKRAKLWRGGDGVQDPEEGDGNEWCLPNAVSVVSSCLG